MNDKALWVQEIACETVSKKMAESTLNITKPQNPWKTLAGRDNWSLPNTMSRTQQGQLNKVASRWENLPPRQ